MGRHQSGDADGARRSFLPGLASLLVLAVVAVLVIVRLDDRDRTPDATPAVHTTSLAPAAPSSSTARPTTSAPAPSRTADPDAAARAALTALVDQQNDGDTDDRVSVAVTDLASGRTVSAGATHGMLEASVAKLQIVQTLLLQQDGDELSDTDDDLVTRMIEHSDNNAADTLFGRIGGPKAYATALPELGLSATDTVPGGGYYWGLSTSSAAQQLVLLRNLVSTSSPLTASARTYVLKLMRDVESDQRWGVSAAADKGSTVANKNGWLAVDADDGLWAVNSDGIITVHGRTVLISVMTQHNKSYDAGIDLVEKLAKAAVPAVAV